MFKTAIFEIDTSQTDFPYIGKILDTKYEGEPVQIVVKEITGLQWKKNNPQSNGLHTLLVEMLVMLDESALKKKKRKQVTNRDQSSLRIIEGGKS